MLEVIGGAVVSVFLVSAFTPFADVASARLSASGRLEQASAIVVLGGGGVRKNGTLSDASLRRTLRGIELYRRGLAPVLVLSGPAHEAGVEARLRAELARQCGVAANAILTETEGRTTREEALRIVPLLRGRALGKILLVVDAEGITRATAVFRKAGVEVVAAAAGDVPDGSGTPEARLAVMRRVITELTALLYYRVAGYV